MQKRIGGNWIFEAGKASQCVFAHRLAFFFECQSLHE